MSHFRVLFDGAFIQQQLLRVEPRPRLIVPSPFHYQSPSLKANAAKIQQSMAKLILQVDVLCKSSLSPDTSKQQQQIQPMASPLKPDSPKTALKTPNVQSEQLTHAKPSQPTLSLLHQLKLLAELPLRLALKPKVCIGLEQELGRQRAENDRLRDICERQNSQVQILQEMRRVLKGQPLYASGQAEQSLLYFVCSAVTKNIKWKCKNFSGFSEQMKRVYSLTDADPLQPGLCTVYLDKVTEAEFRQRVEALVARNQCLGLSLADETLVVRGARLGFECRPLGETGPPQDSRCVVVTST